MKRDIKLERRGLLEALIEALDENPDLKRIIAVKLHDHIFADYEASKSIYDEFDSEMLPKDKDNE